MSTGTVKWFSVEKGYGFITLENGGKDVVAYQSAILENAHQNLREGQEVELDIHVGRHGAHALNVRPQ